MFEVKTKLKSIELIKKLKLNQFLEELFHSDEEQKKFDLFSINVSTYNYSSHLVLIGDIKIRANNEIWLIATNNQQFTGKMAEQHPEFNLRTTIFDKVLDQIPKFDEIYQYISNHQLIDVIVEFAYYDIPVSIYQENIIVFEIRTHF